MKQIREMSLNELREESDELSIFLERIEKQEISADSKREELDYKEAKDRYLSILERIFNLTLFSKD